MKKLSIITAALLLMFVGFQNTNAQAEFGLKGGLNLTSWSQNGSIEVTTVNEAGEEVSETFNELKDTKFKPGFHAGVYGMFDMGAFTITPELLYSQKGSNEIGTVPGTGESVSSRWDYLSVPIMFGIQLFDVVGLQVGPQVGYLMVHKNKADIDKDATYYDAYNEEVKLDEVSIDYGNGSVYKRTYSELDFGIALGVTFDVSGRVNAGVRYTHGLGSVIEEDYTRSTGNLDSKTQNRTLQAFIGIPLSTTER